MKEEIMLFVDVTKQDIEKSEKIRGHRRCTSCPIAVAGTRAVRKYFGNKQYSLATAMNQFEIYANEDDAEGMAAVIWRSKELPFAANDFISRADSHRNIEPFQFEVTVR